MNIQLLNLDLVKEYEPEVIEPDYYRFKVDKYEVKVFNFEMPARAPWSAEIVIMENGLVLSSSIIIHPLYNITAPLLSGSPNDRHRRNTRYDPVTSAP